ncbi:MAG: AEC family transporter [Pseudomonadota bacterium]
MQHILWSILPIFLITMLGSIIKHKWITSDEFWRGLEKLSYFLLFPVLLFNNIAVADFSSSTLTRLIVGLILATSIVSIGLIMYDRKYPLDKAQFTSIFQGSIRYNNYIFFALGAALHGSDGMSIVAVISAYMIIFTNALSVFIFSAYIPDGTDTGQKKPSIVLLFNKFASNPLIIGSLCGFLFNYSDFELNIGIKKTLESLSNSALAMGMMNVGAGLRFNINIHYLKQIALAGVLKLFALPIVSFIVLSCLSVSGMPLAVGLLYSGVPCASTSYVLAKQLGGDHDLMASIITLTTIVSVLSLSLWMYLLT